MRRHPTRAAMEGAMAFSDEQTLIGVDNAMVARPLMDWLRQNGIHASLAESDDMGGTLPSLAFVHGTYIQVPPQQHEEAKHLIDKYLSAKTAPTDELDGDQ
jgi:hypothetical protein